MARKQAEGPGRDGSSDDSWQLVWAERIVAGPTNDGMAWCGEVEQ